MRPADRSIKVRVLVDDINLAGKNEMVASMDAHPNIEIRIFNPFANCKFRSLDFNTDLDRVNHRTHNRTMVMDNAVAIIGGRNIGDHYFGVATDANFRDLDIAIAGPVVCESSNVFCGRTATAWCWTARQISCELLQTMAVNSAIIKSRKPAYGDVSCRASSRYCRWKNSYNFELLYIT